MFLVIVKIVKPCMAMLQVVEVEHKGQLCHFTVVEVKPHVG